MTRRRALVAHVRLPAFDRDSGSQDVDNFVRFLLDDGWQVTFVARDDDGEGRHAERLRRMGVATYVGFGDVAARIEAGGFDLALIAFWELAAELIPLLRKHSPDTRVVVNSMDVHFLRVARRSLARQDDLDVAFGADAVRELNTYNAADAVIAVSDKERDLLADFLGHGRVFTLPLAEHVERSPHPLDARRGMYFVGNFRHVPNREAVEYLAAEVLPLLDRELLDQHPVTILGNWLDRVRLDVDPATPGLRLVGWVPSVHPYIARSRVGLVPLLHGAGVKRKVIQSMMAGTPVVTTPVGAEGLDLTQGEHALVATDAADFAAGIMRLLTDDDLWHHIADAGAVHVDGAHSVARVKERFDGIVERVLSPSVPSGDAATAHAVRRRIGGRARPGDVVLVAATSPDDVPVLPWISCWPFPQGRDGGWAGYEPVDAAAAIHHLEAQRVRGARWFVVPKRSYSWRHRLAGLFDHLDATARRVHDDEHLAMYDLREERDRALTLEHCPAARVRVIGTHAADRTGPPPALVRDLGSSDRLKVEQRWFREGAAVDSQPSDDVDYVVHVRDDAVVSQGFLETLIATQVTLGVDRVQPTHADGPAGGPPITERHGGTLAREVDRATVLPVTCVRSGASVDGAVVLLDTVSVGLRRPLGRHRGQPDATRRSWVAGAEGAVVVRTRPEPDRTPRISVVVATYERPELLRACLASFADQTLDRADFEVVVVDDGSPSMMLDEIVDEFRDRMQVVGLRIDHAGRSAAKNHAVLLSRAPLVLFFDDDDRAARDYLERHLAAHDARPDEAVAILGHTDWAPEVERTPLMHFITDVDRLLFAYDRLKDGQELDWRGFWEGRISCKRAFLVENALHDQRLSYSIDVEMGWRLAPAGLRVVYDATARSFMARPIDFDAFCERTEAKGRAHAVVAALHPGSDMVSRLKVDGAAGIWAAKGREEAALRGRVAALERRCRDDESAVTELHAAYRAVFQLLHAKGVMGITETVPATSGLPTTVQPFENTDPELAYDATPVGTPSPPLLSVTLPVWSRTPELAEMARATVDRIWEVARIPTEVVVVDNGSPYDVPLQARVYRYPENKGVATGWNTGIRLSSAPMVVVLNSDCRVEPGWDVALYEAASDGRRVAFPYTDHCDGLGFTSPDQGGTAGWCFMLSKALYDEVGVFDEWFNPAFCEDTDYWHRAWQMGVELSPVPAARVVHARRTTASSDSRVDMLLQAHRYKYGWKHGVDPDRAPPYYNREVVDYVASYRAPDPGVELRADRPRVFCIGLNKTGTSSFHEAMTTIGYQSLHWGGPALRRFIEVSLDAGEPLLSRLDQRFDAFSDIQVLSTNFELLDAQYPGSRFVLTVRPVDEWIDSRRRHVEANQRRNAAGEYGGEFLTVDPDGWRAMWDEHVTHARRYFAGRDDFLELDVTACGSWQPLCAFLGAEEPDVPFPWVNRNAGKEGNHE